MDIPMKRLNSGFEMPVFGIGTWRMGGDFYKHTNNNDKADIKAIQSALDLGITHIDSSELYAHGHTEELVGVAIKKFDRKKLFICTKVSPLNLQYKDLIQSAKKSLQRYQIDYLDLYLIHFPNRNISFEVTMPALDKLVDSGLIRYFGVSNFTVEQMKEAQSFAYHKIVANQYQYNLIFREPEKNGLLEYCQKNDIILIAWRPIRDTIAFKSDFDLFDSMCKKYKKTPIQMAINWLISQLNVVTLAKSRNIEHLKENLGAIGWQINKEDIEILREEFPNQKEIGVAWRDLRCFKL